MNRARQLIPDLTPGQELLLSAGRTEFDKEAAQRFAELAGGKLDWKTVYELGYRHRICPLLFRHLSAAGFRAKLAPPEFSFKHLRINDLPMDDDANQAEPVKRLKSEITATRGPLFVTAEYNCTLPGVLKNAIDHASRPYGQSVWKDKPAGVLGFGRGHRHGGGATAFARRSRLPRHADARPARSL